MQDQLLAIEVEVDTLQGDAHDEADEVREEDEVEEIQEVTLLFR